MNPRNCRSCRRPFHRQAIAASHRGSPHRAKRSRMALVYSARLRRWTAPIRPGWGSRPTRCRGHSRARPRRRDTSLHRAAGGQEAASSRLAVFRRPAPRFPGARRDWPRRAIERKAARLHFLVMTSDAVPVENGLRGRARNLGPRRRLAGRRTDTEQPHGCAEADADRKHRCAPAYVHTSPEPLLCGFAPFCLSRSPTSTTVSLFAPPQHQWSKR